jgi:ADP-ribose pyrophosphatase
MPDLKVLKSERLYAGRVFNLIVDQVEYPSGNRSVREVAEHSGGAVAVPLFDDGSVLLVRQYRYPVKAFLYELPAGKLQVGEDPQTCAARELEEETGYIASRWEKLTAIYTTPGFCTEQLHIFLAMQLQPSTRGQSLEEGEMHLTNEKIPFATAVGMIEAGTIVDSKTICGILLAERRMRRPG